MSFPTPVRDVIALIARLAIGWVLSAHGCQKLFEYGIPNVQKSFEGMGAPAPSLSAWVTAIVELGGGILLILGAFTAIAGTIVALEMLGAFFTIHIGNPIFVEKNGGELVLMIAGTAILLAAFGAGKFSVDALLNRNKAKKATV